MRMFFPARGRLLTIVADDDLYSRVVLVDELDQMVTKKQDVIYNFFNWPHLAHSKLIVIAIANTMDLPERELSGKLRSRLGRSNPARWSSPASSTDEVFRALL